MTDRPLAPLLTFGPLWDDLALEGAGEAELRAELRAQRAARATAYAEGRRDALNGLMRLLDTATPIHYESVLARVDLGTVYDHIRALRHASAPRREEP